MKVITKQQILTDIGYVEPGATINLPDHIAREWINSGKAMPAPNIETATMAPGENTMKAPAKRRSKAGGKHGIKANHSAGR